MMPGLEYLLLAAWTLDAPDFQPTGAHFPEGVSQSCLAGVRIEQTVQVIRVSEVISSVYLLVGYVLSRRL